MTLVAVLAGVFLLGWCIVGVVLGIINRYFIPAIMQSCKLTCGRQFFVLALVAIALGGAFLSGW